MPLRINPRTSLQIDSNENHGDKLTKEARANESQEVLRMEPWEPALMQEIGWIGQGSTEKTQISKMASNRLGPLLLISDT